MTIVSKYQLKQISGGAEADEETIDAVIDLFCSENLGEEEEVETEEVETEAAAGEQAG